jgi:hypothetical protein
MRDSNEATVRPLNPAVAMRSSKEKINRQSGLFLQDRERGHRTILVSGLIWFIWSIWFISLIWFNQISKTNQINQMNKRDGRTFSASCQGFSIDGAEVAPYYTDNRGDIAIFGNGNIWGGKEWVIN